jgi:magnesium-transporting ATPase (P-type)
MAWSSTGIGQVINGRERQTVLSKWVRKRSISGILLLVQLTRPLAANACRSTSMSAATTPETHITAYRESVEQVLAALASDVERGLSEDAAQRRLESIGRNQLTAEDAVPGWRRFLAQFGDVLVVLLLIATAISAGLCLYERESALFYEARTSPR